MNLWWMNCKGVWDQGLLLRTLRGDFGRFPLPLTEYVKTLPPADEGAIAVVNGMIVSRPNGTQDLGHLKGLPWSLLLHTSDESHEWDSAGYGTQKWMSYATPEHMGDRRVLIGPQEDTLRLLPPRKPLGERRHEVFFAGQSNNIERRELQSVLGDRAHISPGFSQGLERRDYLAELADTKVAPCPSGTVHPDSFRLYEAIEAGCMPVVDTPGWWQWMGTPVRTLEKWTQLPLLLAEYREDPLRLQLDANSTQAWWHRYCVEYKDALVESACRVSGTPVPENPVTVIMTTSPVHLCPDTRFLQDAVARTRSYPLFRDAPIILCFDGVRPEQEHYRARYLEYMRRVLDLIQTDSNFRGVMPLVFRSHVHQAHMAKAALGYVKSPFVFFQEHDTYPMGEIDWDALLRAFKNPAVNYIRLSIFPRVLPEHRYLFPNGEAVENIEGAPLVLTRQYSQRPHLARTEWYKWLLSRFVTETTRAMIEDLVIGWAESEPWGLYLYSPPTPDITRSGHSFARAKSDPKWTIDSF